jgi:hypothetical protein
MIIYPKMDIGKGINNGIVFFFLKVKTSKTKKSSKISKKCFRIFIFFLSSISEGKK